ncbi:Nn.00g117370.m01.CDS01 [Neocucurbitaria sp. VM-36]
MGDYILLVIAVAMLLSILALFLFIFRSNERTLKYNIRVQEDMRSIRQKHIQLTAIHNDTAAVLKTLNGYFPKIDTTFELLNNQQKPKTVRFISRDRLKTERKLGYSEGRRAQLAADLAATSARLERLEAQKTQYERDHKAAGDHVQQLLGITKELRDQAQQAHRTQQEEVIAAVVARIAQLQEVEAKPASIPVRRLTLKPAMTNLLTSPPLPKVSQLSLAQVACTCEIDPVMPATAAIMLPSELPKLPRMAFGQVICTHDSAPATPVNSLALSFSEVKLIHAAIPIEPATTPDASVIEKISQLESQLEHVNGDLKKAQQQSFTSEVSASKLQDDIERMKEDHAKKMTGVEEERKKAVEEYRNLEADIDGNLKKGKDAYERKLYKKFNDEKAELEKEHRRLEKQIQGQIDAAEDKWEKVSSEKRELEMDLRQLEQALKEERKLHCKSKELVHDLETQLDVFQKDPAQALSDDQKSQLRHYPIVCFELYGNGTTENPGLVAELDSAEQTLTEQERELDVLRMNEFGNKQQIDDQMKEIIELRDKNIELEVKLEDLEASMLPEDQQDSIAVEDIKSLGSPKQDIVVAAKPKDKGDKLVIRCKDYTLVANEKFVDKTCQFCDMIVALPHWRQDDGLWVPKWPAHMKHCSFCPNVPNTQKQLDEKTTSVANENSKAKGDQSQDKPSDSTVTSGKKPPHKYVWKSQTTQAQDMPPESTMNMRMCKKCSKWVDFKTRDDKDTLALHQDICTMIICKHDGCGDVMENRYFFEEHQKPCKERSVQERKRLSRTEAERLLPPQADNTLERLSILSGPSWKKDVPSQDPPRLPKTQPLTPKGPRKPAMPTPKTPRTPAGLPKVIPTASASQSSGKDASSPDAVVMHGWQNSADYSAGKDSQTKKTGGGLMGNSKHAPTQTVGGLVGNSIHAPKEKTGGCLAGNSVHAPKEKTGGLVGYSRWAPKKDEGEKKE